MAEDYVLWGSPHSLYTGKARSYLIKKQIAFRELFMSHTGFRERVLPAIGYSVIPVLECPDGQLVQDTTDIIAFLESRHPERGFVPAGGVQRAVAMLIGAWASEALLPTAMHYRWSYYDDQKDFLIAEFGRLLSETHDREARIAAGQKSMAYLASTLPGLGVTPATSPAIEAAWTELLGLLDTHFLYHPYLLGGRPSIADFGLMAPAYAHLARDPVPSVLMKRLAPNVFRWTERMNLAQIEDGEFPDCPPDYLASDAIPQTLEPVLAHIFAHWGPELLAATNAYNSWAEEHSDLPAGAIPALSGRAQAHPGLGQIRFPYRDVEIERRCAPQSLWHFQKAAEIARALTGPEQVAFNALIESARGGDVMRLRLKRPLRRDSYHLAVA